MLFGALLCFGALAFADAARIADPIGRVRRADTDSALQDFVSWDGYSFSLNGSRIFLQAGEWHPFRLPVPDLWPDIMQKFKAAGLNAVTTYTHWALTNPKDGVLDLGGFNDFARFVDAAHDAGLFVIARPGPYINAETTGGGIPGHVLNLPDRNTWFRYNGEMRSNDTLFENAWKGYITEMAKVIAKRQVTNGGPVILVQIENEYYNGPGINEYFEQLTETYRENGVIIPTMDNDPGMYQNLVHEVDIYGFDAYPVSFNCGNPGTWRDTPSPNWRPYHESVFPDSPLYFPEFQGGAFSRPNQWSNEQCRQMVFSRILSSALGKRYDSGRLLYDIRRNKLGQIAYPDATTSYDFAAAISESRQLTDKYGELKVQSMFLRNFPDLRKTDLVGEDNTTHVGVNTTHLRNPDTGAEFFISRHQVTNESTTLTFKLDIGNNLVVPQLGGEITIAGRDSKVITKNLSFGSKSKVQYSTAPLFSSFAVDGQDVLVAYGTGTGETFEIAIASAKQPLVTSSGPTKTVSRYSNDAIIFNFSPAAGLTFIRLTSIGATPVLLVIADYATATRLWHPTIPASLGGPHANYFDLGARQNVLVSGPYLVRTVSLHGTLLALTGDLDATTFLTVITSRTILSITWNGKPVPVVRDPSSGALKSTLAGPRKTWSTPDLSKATWRYADSLPEISPEFSEADEAASGIIAANHTTTTNPFPPFYGGPWVLYGGEYNFYSGNLLWRGAFENGVDIPAPTAVNLSVSGGKHFAYSAWLNDVYLGASDTTIMTNNDSFTIPNGALRQGTNYVTVLQDHMGHNLAGMVVCCTPGGRQYDIQLPRGIQGYYLVGRDDDHQFTGWKVAGNLGGKDFPDTARKILNEGGLYGERVGWHLPGFDDASWEKRTPFTGLTKPGVGWFRTTFTLNIPDGYDVPMAFKFSEISGHYRAQLYVNGWQFGKRIANLGPQTLFPVPSGILKSRGENVVAVSLWSLGSDPDDLHIPSIELVELGVYLGGPGRVQVDSPGWAALRG
ncbi:glycoside hydrolase family 35 protein [Auriculariales sp. MPI-PUGE-AT-0066]|nr:glycoside hydrolase family 35 protein [Auriculariales sp. MPI-PUGE-AT-0066]